MAILIKIRRVRGVNRDLLRRAARAALVAEGLPSAVEVSVLVTDDQEMRQLNRDYRRLDATTDVLAFPQQQCPDEPGPHLLGDIVISAPAAQRQARARHITCDREMALLAIHGVLHLAGWRDDTDDERRRMLGRGRDIWRSAAPRGPSGDPARRAAQGRGEP
ncbi:MAG TPA: rRNA maturation RNase YbeY [Armatimonadota bacterium]|nr:rRNA maturation RNase YbeY [Armatimonadota bacterium]